MEAADDDDDFNQFGDFLFWKETITEVDLSEINAESDCQNWRRQFFQQFSHIGPLPYTTVTSEYTPFKQQFFQPTDDHVKHQNIVTTPTRKAATVWRPAIVVTTTSPKAAPDPPVSDDGFGCARIDPGPAQIPENCPTTPSSSLQEELHPDHLYSNQLLHLPSPASGVKQARARGLSPFSFHKQLVGLLRRLEHIRSHEQSTSFENQHDESFHQFCSTNSRKSLVFDDAGICVTDDESNHERCGRFSRRKGIRRKRKQVKMGNRGSQPTANVSGGDVKKDPAFQKLKQGKDEDPVKASSAQVKDVSPKQKQKLKNSGQKDAKNNKQIKSTTSWQEAGDNIGRLDANSSNGVPSSNSGDSIVSLADSLPNGNQSELRIESTSSPDSSSVSSSLYVDTQEKFLALEDGGTGEYVDDVFDEQHYQKRHRRSVSQVIDAIRHGQVPLLPTPEREEPPTSVITMEKDTDLDEEVDCHHQENVELEDEQEVDADDDEDDEDGSYHDTHEDASSCDTDNSPQKETANKQGKKSGTRSYPGTPDTQLDGFCNFPMYHKYGGSSTNIYGHRRASLSPIGSVNRLDLGSKLIEDDDEELVDNLMFKSTTSLVVPKFRIIPHQKVSLQSPSHRFRTPPPVANTRRELCNSELCLRAGPPSTVPQVLRRYCSQNFFATPPSDCCGSVLKRVASLTLDKATLEKKVQRPKFVPEKLDFSLYEKFEGQMLVNWFCSAFPEDHYLMNGQLSRQDLRILVAQFCTHLLAAGVLKQIEDDPVQKENLFRPDLMYFWSKLEAHTPASNYATPGKISPSAWPPSEPKLSTSNSYSEKDLHNILQTLKNEHQSAIERIQKEQENNFITSQLKSTNREYEDKVSRLELQVEKYQTLAGIESLTRRAKYVSCPTSPQDIMSPSGFTRHSYTQTDPPKPTFNASTQFDVSSTTTSRSAQTDSARCFSTGVQTYSVFRCSVQVQTENLSEVTHGFALRKSLSYCPDLPCVIPERTVHLVPESCLPRPYAAPSLTSMNTSQSTMSTLSESSVQYPFLNSTCHNESNMSNISPGSNIPPPTVHQENFLLLPLLGTTIAPSLLSVSSVTQPLPSMISESHIPPPPPMPGSAMLQTSTSLNSNILSSVPGSNIPPPPPFPGSNIPPPPPLPGSNIPPPPPLPGSNIPPPPPLPGSNISIPSLLPGSYIPPPPPLPGSNIPPPPPLPGSYINPPPPLPGSNIPPPPPLPGSNIPPPPPLPGSNIPPPPPLPGSNIPPPPPLPGSNIPPPPPLPGSNIPPPPPLPGSNIPPPPPLPGSNIPPPPPLPGSNVPPPPPPLPGMGIPRPPPPFPGMGMLPPLPPMFNNTYGYTQTTLIIRKAEVKPKNPMKPLYWSRIQVPAPPTPTDNDSTCLWEKLEETTPTTWDEFEELFSKQTVKKKNVVEEKTKTTKGKEVAKLLDQKRSQNVGILISSLHLDIAEVENALYNFDTSVITTDTLQSLFDVRPTAEELQIIRNSLSSNPTVPLDKPEQFLYSLSLIPEYANRIECIMFHSTFAENIGNIENRLNNLKMTCDTLMKKHVQRVLSIVLALGNYMNGGNKSRGQADGFGLEILPKLRDVKSKDNSLTLLHYIVRVYIVVHESDDSVDQALLPLPEPGDVDRALNTNFEDVTKELKKLENQIRSCERKVEKILSTPEQGNEQPLKDIMDVFLKKALQEHRFQKDNLECCKRKFTKTCAFFKYQPKAQNENEWPKEFFGLWASFCLDFKDIWKKEQQKKIKHHIEKSRKRVEEIKAAKVANIVKSKCKSSGLKAKLTKLQSREIQEVA